MSVYDAKHSTQLLDVQGQPGLCYLGLTLLHLETYYISSYDIDMM